MGSLIIRLLALLGLLWTGKQVVHQVSSALHPRPKGDQQASEGEITDEMVKDPVCQTYIPKSLAIQKTITGEIRYFCSEECVSKFLAQSQSKTA
jgi:uncharacterized protein